MAAPLWFEPDILLADTITKLPDEAAGAVVVSGSHGGRYPGYLAAEAGVRAVILNDAGGGQDDAGIGSLAYLDPLGIPAATVSHGTCRIGDTPDMLARGKVSHANAAARALGVAPGQPASEAARLLRAAGTAHAEPPPIGETRSELTVDGGRRRIVLIDSASLVRPDDAGQIVVTGSHGGLIGGDPAAALRVDAYAAAFHDAGIGADEAGTTRLPALHARGIAAVTVAAASARIGEARSVFHDGIVSRANRTATAWGAQEGGRLEPLLHSWATRP